MNSTLDVVTPGFVVTREHQRFAEFCDACRHYRYIGLCYGAPGVGKTLSARQYARWPLLEPLVQHYRPPEAISPAIVDCQTAFYTPGVANSPQQVERAVTRLRTRVAAAVARAQQTYDVPNPPVPRVDLVLIDEADRLRTAGLEQMRDIYDQQHLGIILIGMPGIEKRLARYPQLYSRVGFVHQFRSLIAEEVRDILLQPLWGLSLAPQSFDDAAGVAAIIRITGGNFRLLQRLLTQIERVLVINKLERVTTDVVEAARDSLVIGET